MNNTTRRNTVSEATQGKYQLNNLTWRRMDGTDDNDARLSKEAEAVRKELLSKYPSLANQPGFNNNNGYHVAVLFGLMKQDIINKQQQAGTQQGAQQTTTQQGAQQGTQQQTAQQNESKGRKKALAEGDWSNAKMRNSIDGDNDGKIENELVSDFSKLLDVSIRRSGIFRNWFDRELDAAAKQQICKYLGITYTPSNYANTGGENAETEPNANASGNVDAINQAAATGNVVQLQQALAAAGYYKDRADGKVGPNTIKAIDQAIAAGAQIDKTKFPQRYGLGNNANGGNRSNNGGQQNLTPEQMNQMYQQLKSNGFNFDVAAAQQRVNSLSFNNGQQQTSNQQQTVSENRRKKTVNESQLRNMVREEVIRFLKGRK